MSYQDLLRDPDFTRAVKTIAEQCSVNVDIAKLKCQGGDLAPAVSVGCCDRAEVAIIDAPAGRRPTSPPPALSCDVEFWNGIFAAGDGRAKRHLKTTSLRRDRKSETTRREKWPQKWLFCRRAWTSGRTRARTWDPLIKRHAAPLDNSSEFFQPD